MTTEDIRRDQSIKALAFAIRELAIVADVMLSRVQALETQVAAQAVAIETALRITVGYHDRVDALDAKVRALIESHGL